MCWQQYEVIVLLGSDVFDSWDNIKQYSILQWIR